MNTSFCAEQRAAADSIWQRILGHRFLIETRDGRINKQVFARWLRQDYLFVKAAGPFLTALATKAPATHYAALARAVVALQTELELFEERASATDIELGGVRPTFVTHAYVQFLMATALGKSYPEAYTVLYAAEQAYLDSWTVVKAGIDARSPWYPLVENWTSADFAAYVRYLEHELDALARGVTEAVRARMSELFEITAKYELAFWEMAVTEASWPALGPAADGGPSGVSAP
jgi:thiaminase/transcriptional activator TenA